VKVLEGGLVLVCGGITEGFEDFSAWLRRISSFSSCSFEICSASSFFAFSIIFFPTDLCLLNFNGKKLVFLYFSLLLYSSKKWKIMKFVYYSEVNEFVFCISSIF
jgi:hypothetical protein